jgi:N-acyl-D-aspartate/D-glutamate deacylase
VWRDTTIGESATFPEYVGRGALDIAAERGVDPLDAMLDIALAEDLHTRFRIVISNNDAVEMAQLLKDPRTMLGAHDAGAHVDMLCDSNFPSHLLGYWVREAGVLSIEEAVWRLSGQPAEVFRLAGRGLIREGYAADLVAFDPEAVAAIPEERVWDFPGGSDRLISRSTGIEHTWVNGITVRAKGDNVPGATPGTLVH